MAAWLSAGTPHGKERCACPADEGSTAAAHPARSGDTQAVLLTDLSGSSASSRQPPQLPHQGSRTRPAISSKGATENIITPPPLTSRKRAGARQTLRLSRPHPRQCSLLGDLSRPRHCDFGSVPHSSPASTAHAWGEPDPAFRLRQLPANKGGDAGAGLSALGSGGSSGPASVTASTRPPSTAVRSEHPPLLLLCPSREISQ